VFDEGTTLAWVLIFGLAMAAIAMVGSLTLLLREQTPVVVLPLVDIEAPTDAGLAPSAQVLEGELGLTIEGGDVDEDRIALAVFEARNGDAQASHRTVAPGLDLAGVGDEVADE